MAILVVCPGCKKSFNVDDKFAGKTGPCPKCKTKITIPEKQAEVKVHAPEEFSGGGRGVTGKLALKPIARNEARLKPAMMAVIGGVVVAAVAWALVVRFVAAGPGHAPLCVERNRTIAGFTAPGRGRVQFPPRRRVGCLLRHAALCPGGRVFLGLHDSVGRFRLREDR